MNRIARLCLLPLALTFLAGCANMQGGSRGGLSDQVNRHEQQIQGLLSQVGQVEQVLPGQAEMWAQVQSMRQELNTINGQINSLQTGGSGSNDVGVLQERIRRLEVVVRQMGSQLGISVDAIDAPMPAEVQHPATPDAAPYSSSAGYPATPGTGTPSQPPLAPVTPVIPAASGGAAQQGDTAKILYDSGIKAFDNRKYKDAVAIFKDFSATFPKHSLAGNAAFWEGESYYQMKDYGRAALAYQNVIEKYAGSSKVQSSMLKQGMALHYADKKAAATERFQDLIKRYPNSPESTRAKQFMEKNK